MEHVVQVTFTPQQWSILTAIMAVGEAVVKKDKVYLPKVTQLAMTILADDWDARGRPEDPETGIDELMAKLNKHTQALASVVPDSHCHKP